MSSVQEEIDKLLTGCLSQDRKAQKELYKKFYGFAMGICLRYAGNRSQAAEIMNQGFLKIFMNLDKYNQDKPFKAWVGRIMINTSITYYHSNLRMSKMEDLDIAEGVSYGELPDSKLHYDDLLSIVHRLPPAYRTVFNLYAIEGYNHEEIGKMLNISDGTSKSNLFKARDKLKQMLKEVENHSRSSGNGDARLGGIRPLNLNIDLLIRRF